MRSADPDNPYIQVNRVGLFWPAGSSVARGVVELLSSILKSKEVRLTGAEISEGVYMKATISDLFASSAQTVDQ